MQHHYKTPDRRFGVSSLLWDVVFDTNRLDEERHLFLATVSVNTDRSAHAETRFLAYAYFGSVKGNTHISLGRSFQD